MALAKTSKNKLYVMWSSMKRRCLDKHNCSYLSYGGRGISICDQWLKYEVFASWAILNGYGRGVSIDRINNELGYNPKNCRFIPIFMQGKNKRNNILVSFNGETMLATDWSKRLGSKTLNLVSKRLSRGWPIEKAITTKPLTRSQWNAHPNGV